VTSDDVTRNRRTTRGMRNDGSTVTDSLIHSYRYTHTGTLTRVSHTPDAHHPPQSCVPVRTYGTMGICNVENRNSINEPYVIILPASKNGLV
jgi:hypothetical protein